jgi:hypothetical protein
MKVDQAPTPNDHRRGGSNQTARIGFPSRPEHN